MVVVASAVTEPVDWAVPVVGQKPEVVIAASMEATPLRFALQVPVVIVSGDPLPEQLAFVVLNQLAPVRLQTVLVGVWQLQLPVPHVRPSTAFM